MSVASRAPSGRRTLLQQRGAAAEQLAFEHLRRAGLVPVARNVRYRGGEVDLILRDGGTVVFVEVRRRASSAWGGAAASVGAAKQARLILAAQCWLQRHYGNRPPPCRFDVVAIEDGADGAGGAPRLDWLRAAFLA